VLDCEAITDIDVTAAGTFAEVLEWLDTQKVSLHYSRIRPDLLPKLKAVDPLCTEHAFGTNRAALGALVDSSAN
jgi:hypothetical protein